MEKNLVLSTTPVYTLSTASDLSAIPAHSIRQYIDKGLIVPFTKETNRHLFSQVDILRL
jgi:DNA-binding transcriptional MerR regulator